MSDSQNLAQDNKLTDILHRLEQLEAKINRLANSHTIYLGDHEALTRLYSGHRIYVDTRDVGICSHLMLEGRWEPWIERAIRSAVKPGMRFVDAGANFGYYSLLGGSWVGAQGRVYAFEANPEIFRKLRKSVAVNGYDDRVSLFECALSSEEGTLQFHYVEEFSGGGSFFGAESGSGYTSRQVQVSARTLDSLLADVPQIDVMKVDVEGAEPHVLRGATKLLERSRQVTLILEFHEQHTAMVVHPREYLEHLAAQGFSIALIEVSGLTDTLQPQQCLERLNGQLGYLYLTRN